MWSFRAVLALLAFSGGCIFALANPIVGAITYMLVYQVNPNSRWWGAPLANLGFRFSMLAALFTILGAMAAPRLLPRLKPTFTLWELGFVMLLAIGLMNTYALGIGPGPISYMLLDKFWKLGLFLLVINRLASTRRNFRMVLWTLVIGSLYLGYDAYTAPVSAFHHGRLEGVGGPDFNTTSGLAGHMSAMLPLIGLAFMTAKSWKWRALAAVAGAFAVNAIILCRTRSAFVGLAVGALTAMLLAPSRRRLRIFALLFVGGVAALNLTDAHFWERMATMTTRESLESDAAAMTRLDLFRAATAIVADHPNGIGMGNFPRIVGSYDERHRNRACHNTLLLCFVELGVQGVVIFLGMMVLTAYSLWRAFRLARHSADPIESQLSVYCATVAVVTYFVTGFGTERLYCESYWWVMAIPMWIEQMVRREAAERVPELALRERPMLDEPDSLIGDPVDESIPAAARGPRLALP